jgi:hypothetical protein
MNQTLPTDLSSLQSDEDDDLVIHLFGVCSCCDKLIGGWRPLLAELHDNLPEEGRAIFFTVGGLDEGETRMSGVLTRRSGREQ